MKKLITILTLFSVGASFADEPPLERITTTESVTVTTENQSTYENNSITVGAYDFIISEDIKLTLDSVDDSATMIINSSNAFLKVYGDLIIDANASGVSLNIEAYKSNITIYSGGSLTLNGNLTTSNDTATSSELIIENNATLTVNGNAKLKSITSLYGTLNVTGDLTLTKASSNSSNESSANTILNLYDGAEILGTTNIFITDGTSAYKQSCKYTVIDNDVLKNITTTILAGTKTADDNTIFLHIYFEDSTASAVGNVSLGSLKLNNYNKVCIDFLDNPTVGDYVTIEGLSFGTNTTSTNSASTTIEFILTDFYDGALCILDTETTKITRDILTTTANYDSDNAYESSSTVITVTETVDGEEYVHYITLTAYDIENGEDYEFAFDGNYLVLVALVPEPSTYAMVFGALALGLAIYRRRK